MPAGCVDASQSEQFLESFCFLSALLFTPLTFGLTDKMTPTPMLTCILVYLTWLCHCSATIRFPSCLQQSSQHRRWTSGVSMVFGTRMLTADYLSGASMDLDFSCMSCGFLIGFRCGKFGNFAMLLELLEKFSQCNRDGQPC